MSSFLETNPVAAGVPAAAAAAALDPPGAEITGGDLAPGS